MEHESQSDMTAGHGVSNVVSVELQGRSVINADGLGRTRNDCGILSQGKSPSRESLSGLLS